VFGALITTDRYIVREEEPVSEDQYVTSTSALIEGTIDGDLTVFSGSLTISGSVTGNVTVFSAGSVTVEESGVIGGSLNGAATSVSIAGIVVSDVFVAAGATVVEDSGSVGRDVMGFGGTVRIDGSVGRDVRGRSYRMTVDGAVEGDVDVAAQSLAIASTAVIGGDVLYRSSSEASISDSASIGGTVTQLPSQSNFLYGIVLTIANIVSFLGFIVAGLIVLWLARSTGSRAVGSMLTKPLRSFLVGVATVIVLPVLIGFLAITLVGIPVAIILLAIAVILFVVGAVPAVTALGHLILVKRGGLFGAFLVGAVVWRLSIFIPWVGPFLFLIALVWGVGAWVMGVLAARRADPLPPALVPAALVARGDRTPDWDPPRAPGAVVAPDPEGLGQVGDESDVGSTPEAPTHDDTVPSGDEAADVAHGDAADEDQTEPATTDESTADTSDDAPTPDPDEPGVVGDRVVFGSSVAAAAAVGHTNDVDDEDPTGDAAPTDDSNPDDVATDGPEGEASMDPGDDDLSGVSLSERFAALREELLTTGTVGPVEATDDDEDEPEGDRSSGDWGLKG